MLLQQDASKKGGIAGKQLQAGWNTDALERIWAYRGPPGRIRESFRNLFEERLPILTGQTMAKRSELTAKQRSEAVLALLRREEPTAQ